MKRFLAAASLLIGLGIAGSAQAAPGHTGANLNLRAGPGIDYPVVARIPARAEVQVEGCLEDRSWCNVFWRGNYGWTSGRYVRVHDMNAGVPVTIYDVTDYWDRHYRAMPFYADRDKYGYNRMPVPVAVTNRPPYDRAGGDLDSSRNRINRMLDDRWYKPVESLPPLR